MFMNVKFYITASHWNVNKRQFLTSRDTGSHKNGRGTKHYNVMQSRVKDMILYRYASAERGEGCSVKKKQEGIVGSSNIDLDSET